MYTHTMNKIKTADKASISNTEAKSTEIGLKETEGNKALPTVGIVIEYTVVNVLEPYNVRTSEFVIHSGGCKVRVDNKTIHAFRTDLPVQSSKLLSYAVAQLI